MRDSDLQRHSIDGLPPVVIATPAAVGGIWVVRCPYCGRQHAHGNAPGHRAADCPPGTPNRERGYVLLPPVAAEVPA